MPDRLRVAAIGFLATWWVGFFSGWFLARLSVPRVGKDAAGRLCRAGFGLILAAALVAGGVGAVLANLQMAGLLSQAADRDAVAVSGVVELARSFGVRTPDLAGFIRVAYIHNGGYAGGLIGLIASCIWIRLKVSGERGEEGPAVPR